MDIVDATLHHEDLNEPVLKINQKFAQSFNQSKEQREIRDLKRKYGENYRSSDSESSEAEDEFATMYTNDQEDAFAKVLWHLRNRTSELSDESRSWWPQMKDAPQNLISTECDGEPETLKKQLTKELLSSSDTLIEPIVESNTLPTKRREKLSNADTRTGVKESVIEKLTAYEVKDEDILVPSKTLTYDGTEQRTRDMGKNISSISKLDSDLCSDLEKNSEVFMHVFGPDGKNTNNNDEFLKHYFRAHGWKNQMENESAMLQNSLSKSKSPTDGSTKIEVSVSNTVEPDLIQTSIQQYPRKSHETGLRQRDSVRQQKRERKAHRLLEEEESSQTEIQRLKNLQQDSVDKRISLISKISGSKDLKKIFSSKFLTSDFDANDWDSQMNQIFGDDYYARSDANSDVEGNCENDNTPDWTTENSITEKKSQVSDSAANQVNVNNSNGEELKNELSILQKEIKGLQELNDTSCVSGKFKYTNVTMDDIPLTAEDILSYDDRKLNEIAPLRWYAPYVTEQERRKFKFIAQAKRRKESMARKSRNDFKPSNKYRQNSVSKES